MEIDSLRSKTPPVKALLGQRKTWLLLFILVLVGIPAAGLEIVIVYFAARGRMTIEQAAVLSLGTIAVGAFAAVALGWKHMSAMLAEDVARLEAENPKPQPRGPTAIATVTENSKDVSG